MKRRTVALEVEIEGNCASALDLERDILGLEKTYYSDYRIVNVQIKDDGIER